MFREFIASLSKALKANPDQGLALRAARPVAASLSGASSGEADAAGALDAGLTTAFWREALCYSDIETLAGEQKATAPSLTLAEAREGRKAQTRGPTVKAAGEGGGASPCMVVLGLAAKGWQNRKHMPSAHYLLGLAAEQDTVGDLHPKPGEMPFVNPRFVQSAGDQNGAVLATTAAVATALDQVIQETVAEIAGRAGEEDESDAAAPLAFAQWRPLWTLAERLLLALSPGRPQDLEAACDPIARHLDIDQEQDWVVRVFSDESDTSAQKHILDLYDALMDPNQAHGGDLRTFRRLIEGTEGAPCATGVAATAADQAFIAHIDSYRPSDDGAPDGREQFPLDASQRRAVRHAVALEPGEILAINGPPGTGKTATLRAVIAGYWVRAALNRERPPIILGCGATNQAVTNITSAFLDAPHGSDTNPLAQRWNPFVHSYGSFFPSDSYAEKNPEKIETYQGFCTARGQTAKWLFEYLKTGNPFDPAQLDLLKAAYLRGAAQVPELAGLADCDQVVERLHGLLVDLVETWPRALREATDAAARGVRTPLSRTEGLGAHLDALAQHQGPFAQDVVADWWRLVNEDGAAKRLSQVMEDADADRTQAIWLLGEMVLDCTFRSQAFHVAARYWEGRLIQSHQVRLFSATEENLRDALQRISMLAPRLVSTLNTAPSLFKVRYPNPETPRSFGYGMADLLIMDESGQALPEMAAPLTALAKRAVFVGDLKQIKPVSKVQRINEMTIMGRLQATGRFAPLKAKGEGAAQTALRLAVEVLADRGMCSSDGAILATAAHASSRNDHLGRGLTLLFHYRCVQPIIGYCNRLSYGGALRAKTKMAKGAWPPPMSWVEVQAKANRRRGSWENLDEAREIADWVRQSWPRLCDAFGAKPIQDVVAIISAFKPQTEALRRAVEQAFEGAPESAAVPWPDAADIAKMTIGTVHALQGAERDVVLFSGCVDAESAPDPFFNSDSSILNVAVSRAKSAFVFFGDARHLALYEGTASGETKTGLSLTPSRVLGSHLAETPSARRLYPQHLVLVESPKKARVIQGLLGKDYHLVATHGAFRELAPEFDSQAVARGFRPIWTWRKDAPFGAAEVADVAASLGSFDRVILATDDDMEGEGIAWHVLDALAAARTAMTDGTDIAAETAALTARIERVRLGAMTPEALAAAFAAPGELDIPLASAAVARAIADRLVAQHLKAALAAPVAAAKLPMVNGRVRAAILDLCHRHEETVRGHSLTVQARLPDGRSVLGRVQTLGGDVLRLDSSDVADRAIAKLPRAAPGETVHPQPLDTRMQEFGPPPALSTIEVLRRGARAGVAPRITMAALQNLYLGDFKPEEGYESDD